jgi:hypothetical protein
MRLLILALALVGPGAARAQAVHLVDELQIGTGYWLNVQTGSLWGETVGFGELDTQRADTTILFATIPLNSTSIDLYAARMSSSTLVSGAYSYAGTYYPNGAAAELALTYFEPVWRFYLFDRPHLRVGLLPGLRVLRVSVASTTTAQQVRSSETLVLPEIGALLEAKVFPRSIVFGLVKWIDTTEKDRGDHLLQLEGGLSYLMPAPSTDYVGWRLTGGVRYQNLQASRRIGQPDRIAFDLEAVGPYLEVSRLF